MGEREGGREGGAACTCTIITSFLPTKLSIPNIANVARLSGEAWLCKVTLSLAESR